jgi:hypothetical protein
LPPPQVDEHLAFDLPTVIDAVLAETGATGVHWVGARPLKSKQPTGRTQSHNARRGKARGSRPARGA